ncbi:hypothetical protein A2U01_0006394, partial [Trifolium medium]|nr:hypothetical protein [Trifolium medium]
VVEQIRCMGIHLFMVEDVDLTQRKLGGGSSFLLQWVCRIVVMCNERCKGEMKRGEIELRVIERKIGCAIDHGIIVRNILINSKICSCTVKDLVRTGHQIDLSLSYTTYMAANNKRKISVHLPTTKYQFTNSTFEVGSSSHMPVPKQARLHHPPRIENDYFSGLICSENDEDFDIPDNSG